MAEQLALVLRVRKVWSLNPEPAKSSTALQTVRRSFNMYASSCVALATWCGDGHRKLVTRFSVIRRV